VATAAQWIAAARPRTLPAAVAPILVGTGAAAGLDGARPGRAAGCLVVALALQLGVNYANDYSDGIRGTDDERVGPLRLTGSGAARPRSPRWRWPAWPGRRWSR
jgi:1,4-dihydroxy-2-naphthoate octaprenyltransferase